MTRTLSHNGPEVGAWQSSILLRQHDRDHPLRHVRIGGVGRVHRDALIEVIDLEKDPVAICIERAKVVFFVRVVRMAKVVEHRDGFDNPFDGVWTERGNAGRDDRGSAGEMLTQLIVQRANARSLVSMIGPPI